MLSILRRFLPLKQVPRCDFSTLESIASIEPDLFLDRRSHPLDTIDKTAKIAREPPTNPIDRSDRSGLTAIRSAIQFPEAEIRRDRPPSIAVRRADPTSRRAIIIPCKHVKILIMISPQTRDRPPGVMKRVFNRRVRLGATILALAVTIVWLERPLFRNNFGVVDPGKVYRSSQPKGNLDRLIDRYALASVLNLRGGTEADWWYKAEVEAARKAGVAYYDVPMNASRRPGRRELLAIVKLLETCRYPLLIHCKSGADRTGLVSALYLLAIKGEPPETAHHAFSLVYTHIALFGPEKLHEPIHEYEAWLKRRGFSHSRERFIGWLQNDFDPANSTTPVPTIVPGVRPWGKSADRRRAGM